MDNSIGFLNTYTLDRDSAIQRFNNRGQTSDFQVMFSSVFGERSGNLTSFQS